MDWLEHLNKAIRYIEEHLEEEIDFEKVAQIACSSSYHFQRMFNYMANVSLSEYIRRRRLTKAALALQNGEKVIDVAMRYGYDSPTAFNRAFQKVHQMPPSQASKEGAFLKAYPPLTFKLTIQGVQEMDYRIVKKEAFRVVGIKTRLDKDVEKCFQLVPGFWAQAGQEGKLMQIAAMLGKEPIGVLGVSACMASLDEWEYYIAVASDEEVPEGMGDYTVPGCTWAVFPGQSSTTGSIQEIERRIVTEWLPTSGYEYADAPDIEVYLDPDPNNGRFEVWLPIIPKSK